jgi:hypothetical protein
MLKMTLKVFTPAIIVSLLLGFGSVSASEEFTAAWDAADTARKDAAAVGYEWRDTGKILGKAKAAADEGDLDNAMKLVAKAQEQSEDAIAQQQREAGLWQARVPQ